jgi:hypothetical protein
MKDVEYESGYQVEVSWQEIVKFMEFGERNLELLVVEDSVIGGMWMGNGREVGAW